MNGVTFDRSQYASVRALLVREIRDADRMLDVLEAAKALDRVVRLEEQACAEFDHLFRPVATGSSGVPV